MVPIAELLFVSAVIALGVRWYLRTPMHRTRKHSGVHFPTQMAGHMGFGMYSPSDPTPPPHALHGYIKRSSDEEEPGTDPIPEPGDA